MALSMDLFSTARAGASAQLPGRGVSRNSRKSSFIDMQSIVIPVPPRTALRSGLD
jgi:hypothetical protein